MKKEFLLYPLLVFAALTWGGSWVSGKLITAAGSTWNLSFWRFFLTFLSFIPVALLGNQPLTVPRDVLRPALPSLAMSVLGMIFFNLFFFLALGTGFAGKGGVISASLNPHFGFLFVVLFQRVRLRFPQIAGLGLGFLGMLILLEVGFADFGAVIAGGSPLFAMAGFSWAVLTYNSGRVQRHIPVFTYSVILYGSLTVVTLFAALATGTFGLRGYGFGFWFNIVYLAIVVGTLGNTFYFIAARRIGTARTGSFTFLVPVFAMILAWLVLGEKPHLSSVFGGSLSLFAVFLINRSRAAPS